MAARLAVLAGQLAPAPCAAGGPAPKRSKMFEGQVILITGAGKVGLRRARGSARRPRGRGRCGRRDTAAPF
jgi:hypothetical protein